jgi:hypothetical protein
MTPELKTACEVVFQEHKVSGQPIKWSRDSFRGRISIGLCEMAKETLVKKNIIILPNKSKKVLTQLNPAVAAAHSFEEAEKIIENKIPVAVSTPVYETESYIPNHVNGFAAATAVAIAPKPPKVVRISPPLQLSRPESTDTKWWMKPIFLYFIWPVCGAAGGALISLLMNLAYKLLFSH